MVEKTKQSMKKLDATVNVVNADDRRVVEERGRSRGVCVNGKAVMKRMASWKVIESVVKQAMRR